MREKLVQIVIFLVVALLSGTGILYAHLIRQWAKMPYDFDSNGMYLIASVTGAAVATGFMAILEDLLK